MILSLCPAKIGRASTETRRHPLHALLLAAPGLAVLAVLAVPPNPIAVWFAIFTVHLAFQLSNLDYTLGPLRTWLGVAEVHRWHHKREFEDAQVNYGEFLMVRDRIFGIFYDVERRVQADELGLRDPTFLRDYFGQLRYPFAVHFSERQGSQWGQMKRRKMSRNRPPTRQRISNHE